MALDIEAAQSPGIVSRVRNIILKPQTEFEAIAEEPADNPYMRYALPLALLSSIAHVIGYTFLGGYENKPLLANVASSALQLVATLLTLYLVARIANAFAPRFASEKDQGQAHKLVVYGATALFLGGFFAIYPPLAPLAIVGLYSFVLLYIGLPRLMKTPEDKRFPYLATIFVTWIVVGLVIGMGVSAASDALIKLLPGPAPAAQEQTTQTETAPAGSATVDLAAMEQGARAGQYGAARALDPERLKNLLPDTLPGGFRLTSSSATAAGGARAEALYESGAQRITLRMVQTGTVGDMPGRPDVPNYQGADGHAFSNVVDGRTYVESANTTNATTTYVVLGYGLMLSAEGAGGVSPDQARAAVETVGIQRLERELRR